MVDLNKYNHYTIIFLLLHFYTLKGYKTLNYTNRSYSRVCNKNAQWIKPWQFFPLVTRQMVCNNMSSLRSPRTHTYARQTAGERNEATSIDKRTTNVYLYLTVKGPCQMSARTAEMLIICNGKSWDNILIVLNPLLKKLGKLKFCFE